LLETTYCNLLFGWQFGLVVSIGLNRHNCSMAGPSWFLDGWLSADRWTILVCNQTPRSTRLVQWSLAT